MRLNDKDSLAEGLLTATKNDGKQEFFKLRDIYFLKCSDLIKEHCKERVNGFSVTFDKVTVQRISHIV